jgi:hypothetical protein
LQERIKAGNERIDNQTGVTADTASGEVATKNVESERVLLKATQAFASQADPEAKQLTAQLALALSQRQLDAMPNETFNNLLGSLQRKSLEGEGGDIQGLMKKLISSASDRTSNRQLVLSERSRNFLIRMTEPSTLRDLSSQEVKYMTRQERALVDDFIKKNEGKASGIEWKTKQTLAKSLHDISKNSLDKTPVPRSELEAMFAGASASEQEKMLAVLQARKRFMSVESMRSTLRDMASSMRQDISLNRDRYWRLNEEIHVLVTGNSSPGRELAYEFRKATGINLKFHVIEPGSQPPPGNWFLFDKPPVKGDPTFDTYQTWMRKPGAADKIKVPDTIKDFYDGPNLYDALGNTSDNQRLANALKAAAAKTSTTADGSTIEATRAVTATSADRALAAERVLTGFDREGLRLRQAQTLLMLAHETNRAGRTGVQLEALSRLLSLEEVATHISPADQMSQMRALQYELKSVYGEKLKDALFITDTDAMGSSNSATYLYKLANDVPNNNFVTTAQAKIKLASNPDLPVVILDDMVYTGTTAVGKATELAKSLGVKPNKITLAVGGAYEAGDEAVRKLGFNLLHSAYYEETYALLARRDDLVQNNEDALRKVIGEGWKGDKDKSVERAITAGVSTPLMAPNNSSPFVVRLAKYHGIGRANAMALASETEETASREAAQQEARAAAKELMAASKAEQELYRKQRPIAEQPMDARLAEMRASMVDSQQRGFSVGEEDVNDYFYILLDDHKNDPAWHSLRQLRDAYNDQSSVTHGFAKQMVDLQIAASRVEASSLKSELSAAWVFDGAPNARPDKLNWTLNYVASKLGSDPVNRQAVQALRELQTEAESGNPVTKQMALYLLEQMMLGK